MAEVDGALAAAAVSDLGASKGHVPRAEAGVLAAVDGAMAAADAARAQRGPDAARAQRGPDGNGRRNGRMAQGL